MRGAGSLEPQSATTAANGEAATRLTFGPTVGGYEVVASVTGVAVTARFAGTAGPGAVARVVVTPGQVRLGAVGDSSRFRARQYDSHGNAVPGGTISWSAADADVFTMEQTGVVRGARAPAVGRAIASINGRADTAYVVVGDPDASHCLGYSPPVALVVGQAIDVSMTDGACIVSAGGGDEYVLVPWHGSTAGSATVTLQVRGGGLAELATPETPAGVAAIPSFRFGAPSDPVRSFDLERRIREMGRREVMPLARLARESRELAAPSDARARTIPTNVSPGELVDLNANPHVSCTAAEIRTGRVAAVGLRTVIVHDTANPAGGFTDADYRRFAVTFDTLVAPVVETAFGAPTDIDRNGKVVIFFTRAVNEMTPSGAAFYYGGFFHPRDLLPKRQNGTSFCDASNESEMFYMLVPDPQGVVNGNHRRVGFVDSVTVGTLAHEYQHLINDGRRNYVNDATTSEETWLNEGLSHIAEELLFYRATGTGPRQNLGAERFGQQPYDGLFIQYIGSNFGRLRAFLQNPQNFSPWTRGDDVATRGAVWAFLRYAADRTAVDDGDIWMRLTNSRSAGLQNLQAVFGADVLGMVRDWTVSLYTDDHVPNVAAVLTQPSWNFRTAYPALPASARSYPLVDVRALPDDATVSVLLLGGSGAFLRFAVRAGREGSVRVTSNGVAPPASVRATIVRRR